MAYLMPLVWILAAAAAALAAGWVFRAVAAALAPRDMARALRGAPLTAGFGMLVILAYVLVAVFAPLLALVPVWLYTLVFAFASLWYAPYTLAALELGVWNFQSSVAGLGGCPYAKGASGNVATEDVVYMLQGMDIETGIDLDALLKTSYWICAQLQRPNNSRVALARREDFGDI